MIATGHLFRLVNKRDRVAGERMTAQAVFNTVKSYAAAIGIDHFVPHDLRRSYAKLAHKGRARSSRFSCRLDMHQFRRQNGIWASSRTLPMHLVTTWA